MCTRGKHACAHAKTQAALPSQSHHKRAFTQTRTHVSSHQTLQKELKCVGCIEGHPIESEVASLCNLGTADPSRIHTNVIQTFSVHVCVCVCVRAVCVRSSFTVLDSGQLISHEHTYTHVTYTHTYKCNPHVQLPTRHVALPQRFSHYFHQL